MSIYPSPAFSERNIAVFCSTDNRFALYCHVMLHTLISHTSQAWNYDLIILEEHLTPSDKEDIQALARGKSNISIRFFNVSAYLKEYTFNLGGTLTLATWYRLFAPSIFQQYDKIVYLDVDIVVLSDIAELYNTDLGEYWLGGYTDWGLFAKAINPDDKRYFREVIGVDDMHNYINAGVLVWNIHQMNRHNVEQKCIEAAQVHRFRHHDQDTLNAVCRGHIRMLEPTWNVFPARGFENALPDKERQQWEQAKEKPNIIHYVDEKPWDNPFSDMAVHWWQGAASTPYYDELQRTLLRRLIGYVVNYKRDVRRYRVWRLISLFTFGNLRKKLTERKRSLRRHLRIARDIIKSI